MSYLISSTIVLLFSGIWYLSEFNNFFYVENSNFCELNITPYKIELYENTIELNRLYQKSINNVKANLDQFEMFITIMTDCVDFDKLEVINHAHDKLSLIFKNYTTAKDLIMTVEKIDSLITIEKDLNQRFDFILKVVFNFEKELTNFELWLDQHDKLSHDEKESIKAKLFSIKNDFKHWSVKIDNLYSFYLDSNLDFYRNFV